MPSDAVYVYCLAESARRPRLAAGVSGMPSGTRPEAVELDKGTWLVASRVPLDEYGPGQLEAKLRDLDWVSRAAVAHEAVVEHVMRGRSVTVVPLKLFTLFSDADRAIAEMRSRRAAWKGALKRIRGCLEWGVRIGLSPPATDGRNLPEPISGTAFLASKKLVRDAARERAAAAAAAAEAAFAQLSRAARESRRRPAPDRAERPPLLDAAFLVPATRKAAFQAAVRKAGTGCRAAGADLTITGPWPAYNFVHGEETGR